MGNGTAGNEALRVAMAGKGETVEPPAGKVGVDPKTTARWLADGRIPHPRTRIAVANLLGRKAAELWPEPFRRRDLPWFREWAELEQDARSIRSYEPLLVPGLLQTEAYARAVLATGGLLSPTEVDEIVAARLAGSGCWSGMFRSSSSRCSTRWCCAGRSATIRV